MVYLYGFGFLFCLGMAAHRVDTWNHNTESDEIAYKDATACLILAFVVLANWWVFIHFHEKNHFTLFISGMTALFITFWQNDVWAEFLSGCLALAALLHTIFPPFWAEKHDLNQPQNPCWITPARVLAYKYISIFYSINCNIYLLNL